MKTTGMKPMEKLFYFFQPCAFAVFGRPMIRPIGYVSCTQSSLTTVSSTLMSRILYQIKNF